MDLAGFASAWALPFFGGIGVVVTLQLIFSPHLTSPEGEGQIPLAILLLACSRLIVSDLSTTRVTCINLSLTEPE